MEVNEQIIILVEALKNISNSNITDITGYKEYIECKDWIIFAENLICIATEALERTNI